MTKPLTSEMLMFKMRELSKEMQHIPNLFVMTKNTLARAQKAIEDQQRDAGMPPRSAPVSSLHGLPIEAYGTVKECLDRMMGQREGERIKLVLSEDIPEDLLFHPWLMAQAYKMAEGLGMDEEFPSSRNLALKNNPFENCQ
jgi:hypothetical protein